MPKTKNSPSANPIPAWKRATAPLRRLWHGLGGKSQRVEGSDYEARWSMSLRDWLDYHQREIVFDRCQWMGRPMLKSPLDAWIYQEIIFETRPEIVVEIGSHSGGSTLYFAHLLELLAGMGRLDEGAGTVLSLDIDRSRYRADHPRIVEITGDCSAPEIVARVREHCEGRRVLMIHDGDHRREAVLRDLELYAPLVNLGGYLIVEDGILDLFPPSDHFGWLEAGPLPAIDEFLARHPEFEVDVERERYLATYSPRGFLRRVG